MPEVPSTQSSVAVVLLNYNNYDPDTQRCLASLQEITGPDISTVVIDNGSKDGCNEKIRVEFPSTIVLRQAQNLGFTGGNNRGIVYAIENGYDYVMVLNNDTEIIDPQIIKDMIIACKSNPSIGIIGARIYDIHNGEEQRVTLTAPSWTLRQRFFDRPSHSLKSIARGTVSVEGISAVCWIIPTNVFKSVGLLDEDIFIYAEDNEFCYRVSKQGWLIGQYCDRIGINHYFTSTKILSLSSLRHQLSYVNHLYALRKHGASFPLGLVYTVRTILKLLWHLIIHSPKPSYLSEIKAYLKITKNLVRQLFNGRKSIRLSPLSDRSDRLNS